jgi:predicted  nucleic acid-binding Zn-ribbon protein
VCEQKAVKRQSVSSEAGSKPLTPLPAHTYTPSPAMAAHLAAAAAAAAAAAGSASVSSASATAPTSAPSAVAPSTSVSAAVSSAAPVPSLAPAPPAATASLSAPLPTAAMFVASAMTAPAPSSPTAASSAPPTSASVSISQQPSDSASASASASAPAPVPLRSPPQRIVIPDAESEHTLTPSSAEAPGDSAPTTDAGSTSPNTTQPILSPPSQPALGGATKSAPQPSLSSFDLLLEARRIAQSGQRPTQHLQAAAHAAVSERQSVVAAERAQRLQRKTLRARERTRVQALKKAMAAAGSAAPTSAGGSEHKSELNAAEEEVGEEEGSASSSSSSSEGEEEEAKQTSASTPSTHKPHRSAHHRLRTALNRSRTAEKREKGGAEQTHTHTHTQRMRAARAVLVQAAAQLQTVSSSQPPPDKKKSGGSEGGLTLPPIRGAEKQEEVEDAASRVLARLQARENKQKQKQKEKGSAAAEQEEDKEEASDQERGMRAGLRAPLAQLLASIIDSDPLAAANLSATSTNASPSATTIASTPSAASVATVMSTPAPASLALVPASTTATTTTSAAVQVPRPSLPVTTRTLSASEQRVLEQWLTAMAATAPDASTSSSASAASAAAAPAPAMGSAAAAAGAATATAGTSASSSSNSSNAYRSPLDRAGLSRSVLAEAGLPPALISRLHLALFVYSLGVHDRLQALSVHSGQCEAITRHSWNAYSYRLESCDPTGYAAACQSLSKEHARHLQWLAHVHTQQMARVTHSTQQWSAQVKRLTDSCVPLQAATDQLTTDVSTLSVQCAAAHRLHQSLLDTIQRTTMELDRWRQSTRSTQALLSQLHRDSLQPLHARSRALVQDNDGLNKELSAELDNVRRLTETAQKLEAERNALSLGTGVRAFPLIMSSRSQRVLCVCVCVCLFRVTPKTECDSVERQQQAVDDETEAAATHTKQLTSTRDTLRGAVASLERSTGDAQQRLDQTRTGPLAEVQGVVDGHPKRLAAAQAELSHLNTDMSNLNTKHNNLRSDVSALQQHVNRVREDIQTVRTTHGSRISHMNALNASIAELNAQLATAKQQLQEWAQKIAGVKHEKEECERAFEASKGEWTGVTHERRDAQTVVSHCFFHSCRSAHFIVSPVIVLSATA